MELGSCFKNYTDFSEHFAAYKKESRLQFGLKSCVSVRFHNRQNGTHIREDITFMRVKFGCIQSREQAKKKRKKKQQQQEKEEEESQLCPAYLVLEYSEELDRLVITELNSNHIHAEPKAPSFSSDRSPLARLAARMAASRAYGAPPAKLRKEEPAEVKVKVEADSDVSENTGTDAEKCPPAFLSPSEEPGAPQAGEHGGSSASSSSLVHIDEVMRVFQRTDAGSLASFRLGSGSSKELERLSFQTGKMKGLFLRFPESLLLHRVVGCGGHTLYAFLVESKDRVGKLVHLAILRDDTPENVREMLSVFKKFNEEGEGAEGGRRVKAVLVDVAFLHREALRELFPSAQVLLSVYHAVRLLERKLKKSRASLTFKSALRAALREAVFSPSEASLAALSRVVKGLVEPGLFEHLQAHWFSCEMLWYFHAKKGLHACSTYIDSLELTTQKLASLFGPQLSLQDSLLRLVESANDFNTKGLENHLNQPFSNGEKMAGRRSILMEELKSQPRPPLPRRPRPPKHPPPAAGQEPPKQSARHSPAKPVATMLAALKETCTELAYQLCLNEWDVVQKSTQLVTASSRRKAAVQLLEDTHQVGGGGRNCSCYFSCRYQLPCRHVLAVLLANQQVVDEGMVAKRWQRKYQHLPALRQNHLEWPQGGPSAATAAPKERQDMIQSLSTELGNLLLQSEEGQELEERSATLRMIVSIWTKRSELREEEAAATKPLHIRNVGDLPFLWVKKEELEGAQISPVALDTSQTPVA